MRAALSPAIVSPKVGIYPLQQWKKNGGNYPGVLEVAIKNAHVFIVWVPDRYVYPFVHRSLPVCHERAP
jgi:hypothetical protein